jgi:transposase
MLIMEHSRSIGHVPIFERQSKKAGEKEEKRLEKLAWKTLNWKPAEWVRYESRTVVERVFSRLKDEFGASLIRVRSAIKVTAHLMFGVLALAADQLLKIGSS